MDSRMNIQLMGWMVERTDDEWLDLVRHQVIFALDHFTHGLVYVNLQYLISQQLLINGLAISLGQ